MSIKNEKEEEGREREKGIRLEFINQRKEKEEKKAKVLRERTNM